MKTQSYLDNLNDKAQACNDIATVQELMNKYGIGVLLGFIAGICDLRADSAKELGNKPLSKAWTKIANGLKSVADYRL